MPQARDTTFWSRLGVTIAVLAAYWVGSNVPLPGLDPERIAALTQTTGPSALARVSVLSLGIMPLLNALILFEIAKLVAPSLRQWETASFRNSDRLALIAVGLALVMALIQGAGLATALEDVSGLVTEPGTAFRAVCIATLLAGTALAIAFVGLIDRLGLGCGLWLIFLAPALAELPGILAGIAYLVERGEYAADTVFFSLLYSVLAIGAVIGIVLAARGARATIETCLWTPFLTSAVLFVPLLAIGWFAPPSIDKSLGIPGSGELAWNLGLAIAVFVTVWLYARSFARAGGASSVAVAPIAASLAAILIAGSLLESQMSALLPLRSTQLIVAAAVAATLLIRWGFVSVEDTPSEADEEPAD
jgi:preprotein translocase subunit SecY